MSLTGRATNSKAGKLERDVSLGTEARDRDRRHAEDRRSGAHAAPNREGRERRKCDGTSKVSGEKPEGAENAGGDTGDVRD